MSVKYTKRGDYPLAERFLSRVRTAQRKLDKLRAKRDNLRLLTTNTSACLTGMPRSDSPDLQRNETLVVEIDELEEKIIEAERKLMQLRVEVGLTICQLEDSLIQAMLIMHYLDGMTWKKIGKQFTYGRTRVYDFRDRGLAQLEKRISESQNLC